MCGESHHHKGCRDKDKSIQNAPIVKGHMLHPAKGVQHTKNRPILTYRNIMLKKFVLFVFALDHIGNFFVYFELYDHGKLDLKFVQGRKVVGSNKICPRKVYIYI